MADREFAIEKYESFLMGNGRKTLLLRGTDTEKQDMIACMIQYAILHLLQWTPQEAYEHLTWSLLVQLKLDHIINKHIDLPEDVDRDEDPEYFVALAFPDQYPFSRRHQVIKVYDRLMRGEINRFPHKMFKGVDGSKKSAYLLQYVIRHYMAGEDIPGLYRRFGDYSAINRFLADVKLASLCRSLYQTPLDYLHYSLPENERSDLLYALWQYNTATRMMHRSVYRDEY